jgi:hypothetical protein
LASLRWWEWFVYIRHDVVEDIWTIPFHWSCGLGEFSSVLRSREVSRHLHSGAKENHLSWLSWSVTAIGLNIANFIEFVRFQLVRIAMDIRPLNFQFHLSRQKHVAISGAAI